MLFEQTLYVGIDPAAGRRKSSLAAIDSNLEVVRLERGMLDSILAVLAGMQPRAAAVTSPQSCNLGIMERPYVRYLYQLNPESSQFTRWRVCEFELRRRSLRLKPAPAAGRKPAPAVQNGFKVYQALRDMGYTAYDRTQEQHGRYYLEVPERAAYAALLQLRPYRAGSLEGRLQRQLALYMEGLELTNPMMVLEEITRHKLLTGALNLQDLFEPSMLAALAAAYTAFLAGEHTERVCQVGDTEDGLLTLPAAELLTEYA